MCAFCVCFWLLANSFRAQHGMHIKTTRDTQKSLLIFSRSPFSNGAHFFFRERKNKQVVIVRGIDRAAFVMYFAVHLLLFRIYGRIKESKTKHCTHLYTHTPINMREREVIMYALLMVNVCSSLAKWTWISFVFVFFPSCFVRSKHCEWAIMSNNLFFSSIWVCACCLWS